MKFNTKKELFNHLVKNKQLLLDEKKSQLKTGDSFNFIVRSYEKGEAEKEISDPSTFEGDKLSVDLVINTTNIMDSHSDVHIDGLWSKSLKETKGLYLLQEHKMTFNKVISDDVAASAKMFDWSKLGVNAEGKTQALRFKAVVDKDRNPFMFEQYLKGYVKEHSVGMRYVKLFLAINDKDYKEEKGVWDKYIDKVVNKQDAEAQGYFWAVTEAKVIEGSAVLKGSNSITPTLSVSEKTEPSNDTQKDNEPQVLSTQEVKSTIENYKFKH
jgi:hypothetical protein